MNWANPGSSTFGCSLQFFHSMATRLILQEQELLRCLELDLARPGASQDGFEASSSAAYTALACTWSSQVGAPQNQQLLFTGPK